MAGTLNKKVLGQNSSSKLKKLKNKNANLVIFPLCAALIFKIVNFAKGNDVYAL